MEGHDASLGALQNSSALLAGTLQHFRALSLTLGYGRLRRTFSFQRAIHGTSNQRIGAYGRIVLLHVHGPILAAQVAADILANTYSRSGRNDSE
jgi:hypothetical protein